MEAVPAIIIRFALYVDLAILFGTTWFGLRSLQDITGPTVMVRRVSAIAAMTGIILSALGLWITAAGMAGVSLGDVDRQTLIDLLLGTSAGTVMMLRIGALTLIIVLSQLRIETGPRWHVANLVVSGAALGTLAWSGHAAMSEGTAGLIHLGADIVHLLAAAAWIGALVGLMALLWPARGAMSVAKLDAARRALSDFSLAGSVIVALLILTGLANVWLTVGPDALQLLPTSHYGRLLFAKLALFAAMLMLAARNRFRLTPALEMAIQRGDGTQAARSLRWSLALETAAAILILALVAWFGTLAPPMPDA